MFKKLSELLQKEEKILKSRISPESLENACKKKLAHIKIHKKEIVGFIALWSTMNKEWFELGTLWVHPDWRQKGIATKLFKLCENSTKKNMFLITKSIKVAHLQKKKEIGQKIIFGKKSVSLGMFYLNEVLAFFQKKEDFSIVGFLSLI